ncbi:flagellar basal body-associated FliL family protein [Inediibacterium massiliense]|uniref:flagellar basal body-associated FliL family protein n=1 Tax=Inediibacterium massiliense TaxID=1658111 RepID=UPI0006B5A868|nr:flagellar basal body-associated FliL family protein [Inediibacterium massiliense]
MTTKKIILFSVIGFVLTAVVMGATFYFATHQKGAQQAQVQPMKTYTYSIGEMYANVKDSRKVLKVNIEVEMINEKLKETLDEKRPKMTNAILELLRDKTEEDLSGEKGQKALRQEVLKSIKQVVPSDEIMDVFFVEFIVQ